RDTSTGHSRPHDAWCDLTTTPQAPGEASFRERAQATNVGRACGALVRRHAKRRDQRVQYRPAGISEEPQGQMDSLWTDPTEPVQLASKTGHEIHEMGAR